MRRVPMGPFSIQHVPMRPTVTHPWRLQFVIKVSARSFLRPTCAYGTLQHPTCGTQWLMCYVYLWDHSPSPSDLWDPMACVSLVPFVLPGSNKFKKNLMHGSQTRDPDKGMHGLYHCARCLVILTCLWSHYSIIFSVSMTYRLTYIGYFPFKWKQICAR